MISNIPPAQNPPPLFGATSPSLLAAGDDIRKPFVPFGLHTLLYGTPGAPLVCRVNATGKVDHYMPLLPLSGAQFLPMPSEGRFAPALGEDYEQAIIVDPEKPEEVVVGAWHQVANLITENYDVVRSAVLAHPLEGYFVSKFLSDDVIRHTGNGGTGFDVAAHAGEISQMALLRTALFSCNKEKWLKSGRVTWEDFPAAAMKNGLDVP